MGLSGKECTAADDCLSDWQGKEANVVYECATLENAAGLSNKMCVNEELCGTSTVAYDVKCPGGGLILIIIIVVVLLLVVVGVVVFMKMKKMACFADKH